jgi:hypothetical protein
MKSQAKGGILKMLTTEEMEQMRKEALRSWKYRLRRHYPHNIAQYLLQELEGIILYSLTQTEKNLETYAEKTGQEHTAPAHLFNWILKRNINNYIKKEMKHLETQSLDNLLYPHNDDDEEEAPEREDQILFVLPL